MLATCIRMEQKKLKHSHLWLVFAVIPVIPAVMGAGNYMQNLELLKSGWYSLWTQVSLFYANFFYAPLIAVYCSYIWRVEHMNYNWNTLMTMPVPRRDIFLSKLLLSLECTVGLQLWLWILYLITGKYRRPCHRGAADVPVHGDPQFRRTCRAGADWKYSRTAGLQQRAGTVLAILADDDGDERQQAGRYGRQSGRVPGRRADLPGFVCFLWSPLAEEKRCDGGLSR